MLLIIGGEGAGKRTFAKSLGYVDADLSDAVLDDRPVIFHVEQMVFRNPERADRLLPALEQKDVVICNEVGSGVIPIERGERMGREATGHLCIQLALQATCVVRMVSGIPMVIKGKLPCR